VPRNIRQRTSHAAPSSHTKPASVTSTRTETLKGQSSIDVKGLEEKTLQLRILSDNVFAVSTSGVTSTGLDSVTDS
jgi:hypothetical protein